MTSALPMHDDFMKQLFIYLFSQMTAQLPAGEERFKFNFFSALSNFSLEGGTHAELWFSPLWVSHSNECVPAVGCVL